MGAFYPRSRKESAFRKDRQIKKRVPEGTQGITEEIKFAEEDLQAG
jgi:hypothetical protein